MENRRRQTHTSSVFIDVTLTHNSANILQDRVAPALSLRRTGLGSIFKVHEFLRAPDRRAPSRPPELSPATQPAVVRAGRSTASRAASARISTKVRRGQPQGQLCGSSSSRGWTRCGCVPCSAATCAAPPASSTPPSIGTEVINFHPDTTRVAIASPPAKTWGAVLISTVLHPYPNFRS
jgi:hypothetical protein